MAVFRLVDGNLQPVGKCALYDISRHLAPPDRGPSTGHQPRSAQHCAHRQDSLCLGPAVTHLWAVSPARSLGTGWPRVLTGLRKIAVHPHDSTRRSRMPPTLGWSPEMQQSERERRRGLAGRKTGRLAVLDEIAGASIGTVLAMLAAVRRGKAVHPIGVVHDARLSVRGSREAPPSASATRACRASRDHSLLPLDRAAAADSRPPWDVDQGARTLRPRAPSGLAAR